VTQETILDVIRQDFPQFLAESFAGWRAILAAAFGLPIDDMPLIEKLTARTRLPLRQVAELYMVCGRRAGKSLIAALIAVYFTAYRIYPSLVAGETAQFVVVSASKQQAKTIKRYYLGLMRSRPELAAMIQGETDESVSLANGIDLVVLAGNFRTVRGGTVLSAIVDEAAFLRSEEDGAANTDEELIGALLPGMATIPDAMLMVLSSPHREQGVLYEAYRDHFGNDESDDVLVVQADTRTLNPTVQQSVIDRLYAKDPVKAASEYGARFRTDLCDFITRACRPAWTSGRASRASSIARTWTRAAGAGPTASRWRSGTTSRARRSSISRSSIGRRSSRARWSRRSASWSGPTGSGRSSATPTRAASPRSSSRSTGSSTRSAGATARRSTWTSCRWSRAARCRSSTTNG
jgi:hypothetical protein